MKKIYKLLILIVIQITLLSYLYLSKKSLEAYNTNIKNISEVSAKGEHLAEIKDNLEVTEVRNLEANKPLNKMYKIGEEKANLYRLYYNKNVELSEGDTLRKVADSNSGNINILDVILRESYPNISLQEMGVDTEEEAYQAIQLAIWNVEGKTNKRFIGGELTTVDSIREEMKANNTKLFRTASDIVKEMEIYQRDEELLEKENLVDVNLLDEDTNEYILVRDNEYIYGPYKYEVITGILENAEVTLLNKDENIIEAAKIVDSNGLEIEDINSVREFYVSFPTSYNYVIVSLKANLKIVTPTIYATEENYVFVADTYERIELVRESSIAVEE